MQTPCHISQRLPRHRVHVVNEICTVHLLTRTLLKTKQCSSVFPDRSERSKSKYLPAFGGTVDKVLVGQDFEPP